MASQPRTGTAPTSSRSLSDVERSTARYLLAVSTASASGSDRITTGELTERLNVTPASVTEMVSKLADRGLLDHEKYTGVRLTDEGRALASEAGWRFCVVSTFFDSVVEAPIDDESAFDIGVTLPADGVFRLHDLVSPACLGRCPGSRDGGRCVA
ncbi:metal-dependent transcriptional regulator [Halopenitus persicus]|uniref:metal-dependent transcriptional regulator n=1 Tax=Halopenitus persicus TaxID=1048396 RepID=UPI000BBACEEE|nr:metal-dependent transcriptional regulator [Halopenitus persicus]